MVDKEEQFKLMVHAISKDLDVMEDFVQDIRIVDVCLAKLVGYGFATRRKRKNLRRRKELLNNACERISLEIGEKRRELRHGGYYDRA